MATTGKETEEIKWAAVRNLACVFVMSLSAVDGWPREKVAAAAVVAIHSPLDYQVFQRQSRDEGRILVTGRALADCDRIEARIERLPDADSAAAWEPVPYDASRRIRREPET